MEGLGTSRANQRPNVTAYSQTSLLVAALLEVYTIVYLLACDSYNESWSLMWNENCMHA